MGLAGCQLRESEVRDLFRNWRWRLRSELPRQVRAAAIFLTNQHAQLMFLLRPQTIRSRCLDLPSIYISRQGFNFAYRMASSAANVGPIESNGLKKRPFKGHDGRKFKKQKKAPKPVVEGSHEEVLLANVSDLLSRLKLKDAKRETPHQENAASKAEPSTLPEQFTELDLKISELSSTGDGLAYDEQSHHIYVVPFTAPGDTVRAKVFKHFPQHSYSLSDLGSVTNP